LGADSEYLKIDEFREGKHVRVRLRGELDMSTAPVIAERLSGLGARGEAVLLDLDELAFIDIKGIRLVLAAVEDFQRDGRSLAVTHGSDPVRLIVGLMGVDKYLPYDGRTP
jgi:anti-sigma B factor antagonist